MTDFTVLTPDNQAEFAALMRQANRIALDLETFPKPEFRHVEKAAICPHTGQIRLMGLSVVGALPHVADLTEHPLDTLPDVVAALVDADGPPVCAFNAMFDLSYLLANKVRVPQDRIRCLKVQDQILYAGRRKRTFSGKAAQAEDMAFEDLYDLFGDEGPDVGDDAKYVDYPMDLAAVTKRRLGKERDKSLQSSDFSGRLTKAQWAYNAEDTEDLHEIAEQQEAELAEAGLEHVAALDNACLWTCAWMYLTGLRLSEEGWPQLQDSITAQKAEAEKALLEEVHNALVAQGEPGLNRDIFGNFRTDKANGFKPSSTKVVLQMFHRLGIDLPNTRKATLAMTPIQHPVLDAFTDWRVENSLLTAVNAYPGHVNAATGRIHPSWNVTEASTGRLSCSKPNLQNIPARGAGAKFRNNIVPAPGYKLVVADLSMIEPRIMSILSGDELLRDTFAQGRDAYKVTASIILGIPYEEVTKAQRGDHKVILLALQYGCSAKRMREQARVGYNLKMSLEEAEEIRARFFEGFSGLAAYHRKQGRLADTPAHEHLEIRSLFGRRRIIEHDQRRYTVLTNAETQASAADAFKQALADLPWRIGKAQLRKTRPVACVHDELVLESVEAEAPIAKRVLEITMEDACNRILNRAVPCPVEGAYGDSWAEAKP